MRTNIDIDDELMKHAMKATGATTKRATIDVALRRLVALKIHERKVNDVFELQECERKKAEQEGRLDQWHAQLVEKGNWPKVATDAD